MRLKKNIDSLVLAIVRIIGDYAYKRGKEEKDKELFAIGTQFKDYRIPYNEHLDTLIMWSQKAMRDDRGLSDGIARVYDEQADRIFAEAEDIYISSFSKSSKAMVGLMGLAL